MIRQGLPRVSLLLRPSLRRALPRLAESELSISHHVSSAARARLLRPGPINTRLCTPRHFASDAADQGDASGGSISECVRSLSLLGRRGEEPGAPSAQAQRFAEMLSPEARREVVAAAQKALGDSKGADADVQVPEPTRRDLQLVALNQAIPFVGFGFMDNAILILAGDAIDNSLGVMFGISTLCAAALGNIISDVAGVGMGTVIEEYCARLGLPQPNLSQAQRQLRSVRFTNQFGCAFGLIIGCVIGMFPLLLLDAEKAEKAKDKVHLDDMFKDMVTEARELIGAEHTGMFLVVDDETETSPKIYKRREKRREGYLCCKHIDGTDNHAHVPIGDGVLSSSALSGKIVNVSDLDKEEGAVCRDVAAAYSIDPKSVNNMACVPVHDALGNVVAVIQAINKVGTGTVPSGQYLRRRSTTNWKEKGFTKEDVQVLQALATRISITFEGMHNENEKVHLKDTIRILKEHGTLQ